MAYRAILEPINDNTLRILSFESSGSPADQTLTALSDIARLLAFTSPRHSSAKTIFDQLMLRAQTAIYVGNELIVEHYRKQVILREHCLRLNADNNIINQLNANRAEHELKEFIKAHAHLTEITLTEALLNEAQPPPPPETPPTTTTTTEQDEIINQTELDLHNNPDGGTDSPGV